MSSNDDLNKRVVHLENIANHLACRTDITLALISGLIADGVAQKDGVINLLRSLSIDEPSIKDVFENEKRYVETMLGKVKNAG